MRIVIPIKALSWNSLIRKNHWTVTAIANEFKLATYAALAEGRHVPVTTFPVTILVSAHWKYRKRHDIDSIYAKSVIDQLVDSGILPDDSLEYVREVRYTGRTGAERDELVVEIS